MKTVIVTAFALMLTSGAFAHDGSPSGPLRTVQIFTPEGSFGQGVLLDEWRILTAGHVVDNSPSDAKFEVKTLPYKHLSARLTKIGRRDNVDLAILTLNEAYPQRLAIARHMRQTASRW